MPNTQEIKSLQENFKSKTRPRLNCPLLVALRSLTFICGGHPLANHKHIEVSSSPSRFLGLWQGISKARKDIARNTKVDHHGHLLLGNCFLITGAFG